MRVFILSTGRCGSTAIYHAFNHAENYTSGHETLSKLQGKRRFEYGDNHIESDNRLSWHLGQLDHIFGDEAFYVHLKRNKKEVVNSFLKRFDSKGSIIAAFCAGIRMKPHTKMSDEQKKQACWDYINTVAYNIEFFLEHKTNKMTINLEDIDSDFPVLWHRIGVRGDLNKAMAEFGERHNASKV